LQLRLRAVLGVLFDISNSAGPCLAELILSVDP